jgi:hypothetical protein
MCLKRPQVREKLMCLEPVPYRFRRTSRGLDLPARAIYSCSRNALGDAKKRLNAEASRKYATLIDQVIIFVFRGARCPTITSNLR